MKPRAIRIYSFLYVLVKDWWFYGLWRQLLYLLNYKISKPEKLNILLIYSSGRTGSTVLCSTLSKSQAMKYDDEILRKKLIHYPSFVLGHAQKNKKSWYLIKIKQMNLDRLGVSLTTFIDNLGSQNIYKIHLLRSNEFEHSISRFIAKKRNIYNSKKEVTNTKSKIVISFNKLKDKILWQRGENNREKTETKGLDFLNLTYESHISTSNKLIETQELIFKQLGIEGKGAKPEYIKVLSTDLSQEISNWDEIKLLQNL